MVSPLVRSDVGKVKIENGYTAVVAGPPFHFLISLFQFRACSANRHFVREKRGRQTSCCNLGLTSRTRPRRLRAMNPAEERDASTAFRVLSIPRGFWCCPNLKSKGVSVCQQS